MRAELEILGLDASRHVVDTYADFLDDLGAVRSRDLLTQRSRAEILVAGVKVATQTPPVRSGRRVVFLTLDDGTGPVDATFFEDAQGPYAATVFGSWLLVVRGEVRRTGHRGVSLRATGAWPLTDLHALWASRDGGIEAVRPARPSSRTVRGGHPPPGAGPLQRLPDVPLRRRQAGRRGRQGRRPEALAPQPREPRMTHPVDVSQPRHVAGRASTMARPAFATSARQARPTPRPLGWRPWRPRERATRQYPDRRRVVRAGAGAGRWPARRPRHRRRHRRAGGPGRRARPPGHRGRPQPRRPGRPRPPGPRARRRGHRPPGRPGRPARRRRPRQRRRGAVPRRPRGRRRPRRRAGDPGARGPARGSAQPPGRPAPRRRGRPRHGRSLPAGARDARRRRPTAGHGPAGPGRPPLHPRRARRAGARRRVRRRRGARASGSSPTSSPARCSTSSPVPPPRWSSWSRPWPPGRSTSRWPPSSTCSPTA